MKNAKFFFLILFTIIFMTSCSKISGRYSRRIVGNYGTISTFDFGMFGGVEYINTPNGTSWNLSSSKEYTSKGEYKIDGEKVILNFGGSDRILIMSSDFNTLTDPEGNIYNKE